MHRYAQASINKVMQFMAIYLQLACAFFLMTWLKSCSVLTCLQTLQKPHLPT